MKNIEKLNYNLIAHRGLHNQEIPENSMLSFERAKNKKYIIELDIQILKDGTVIVFHDYNLKRLTGVNKEIITCNYAEISKIKLKNKNNIPTLKEVLSVIKGDVPIIIDIKEPFNLKKIKKYLFPILKDYSYPYSIQTFNPKICYSMKKIQLTSGLILTSYKKYNKFTNFIYQKFILNKIIKPDFIAYNVKGLPNKWIDDLRKEIFIIGWTIENQEDFNKYRNYCDNLICEKIL
jgi:glycerophosphoryl diester phosphodiesterase